MTLFQDSIVLHIPWRDLSKTKKTKSNIAKKKWPESPSHVWNQYEHIKQGLLYLTCCSCHSTKVTFWCNGDLIYTHPQWNLADFLCTDFTVSPVHITWYQSSQSSHCTQSTSLCLLWGWMQSTEAHVLYIKPSSSWWSPESLVFDVFLAFLCVRMDFLGLLLAVKKNHNEKFGEGCLRWPESNFNKISKF